MKEKSMKAKDKNNKESKIKNRNLEDYGYDFVAELTHFTNIDEQRENAKRLEEL